MATITHDDLTVCTPCALVIANGPCEGCESCAFGNGEDCPTTAGERQGERWGHQAIGLTLSGDDPDPFSTRDCDGCGSTLAGERHPAVMFAT